MSFAIHYRNVLPKDRPALKRDIATLLRTRRTHVRTLDDLYTFDVMPRGGHKGKAVKTIFRELRTNGMPIPIYIGDGLTDEDALRAFPGGITIRVGKKARSAARYFVSSRAHVDVFLAKLAAITY